jgi:hypothetical protein
VLVGKCEGRNFRHGRDRLYNVVRCESRRGIDAGCEAMVAFSSTHDLFYAGICMFSRRVVGTDVWVVQ